MAKCWERIIIRGSCGDNFVYYIYALVYLNNNIVLRLSISQSVVRSAKLRVALFIKEYYRMLIIFYRWLVWTCASGCNVIINPWAKNKIYGFSLVD